MTEKRGTGAEYGQEILRERSAEADTPEPTKKVSKKTVLSVIVAAIIAGGAMTAVILTSDKTPAEKVEAMCCALIKMDTLIKEYIHFKYKMSK
ncbi:hypothetical protein AB7Z50_20380 [Providencia rettgeri]